MTALKWLEKHDITKYNIHSISTAKLGTVVVGALGGKKARVSVDDFLPFDTKKIKKENGLSDESLAVLQRLMRSRKMDGRVIALLVDDPNGFGQGRRLMAGQGHGVGWGHARPQRPAEGAAHLFPQQAEHRFG